MQFSQPIEDLPAQQNFGLPVLGGGAGLRHEHFDAIISHHPPFRWFEIITENFLGMGGYPREALQEIRNSYPVIGHCVCMSIGSTDELDVSYLKSLRAFLDEIRSPWVSDHLCFTMVDHTNLNDLIPLPFTTEAKDNVVERVRRIQDILERPLLIENVTRYITVSDREMSEAEFLSAVAEESNCGILLDITNVYLNSVFHEYDPLGFVKSIPLKRVGQMHLAGWETEPNGSFIDSHDAPVPPEVWKLYDEVLRLTGPSSVLVEWDKSLPPVERLLEEAEQAHALMESVCGLEMKKDPPSNTDKPAISEAA